MNVLHLAGRFGGWCGEMVVDEAIFKGPREVHSLPTATFENHPLGATGEIRAPAILPGAWNYFAPLVRAHLARLGLGPISDKRLPRAQVVYTCGIRPLVGSNRQAGMGLRIYLHSLSTYLPACLRAAFGYKPIGARWCNNSNSPDLHLFDGRRPPLTLARGALWRLAGLGVQHPGCVIAPRVRAMPPSSSRHAHRTCRSEYLCQVAVDRPARTRLQQVFSLV